MTDVALRAARKRVTAHAPVFAGVFGADDIPRSGQGNAGITAAAVAIITTEFSRLLAAFGLGADAQPFATKGNAQSAAAIIAG